MGNASFLRERPWHMRCISCGRRELEYARDKAI
jgi:hypothetical protein